jgi:hypothetical protein
LEMITLLDGRGQRELATEPQVQDRIHTNHWNAAFVGARRARPFPLL